MLFRLLLRWLRPCPRPPPRKARPGKWDGMAAVTRETVAALEWLERETETPLEKIVWVACHCFRQSSSDDREHLGWEFLVGQRDCGISMPKAALAQLVSLKVSKGWTQAQLSSIVLGWFSRQPLWWAAAQVREHEGEKP